MAFRKILVFCGFLALIVSCAQVQTLSGGPKDETAPIPVSITPENESVRFTGNSFVLEFEEFVKLKNPTQSISVIPDDFKVNASLSGKTLTLSWSEQLRENTTYSIYLNNTVQDITESNDSLMQLVFSTGDFIDSISYSTYVLNAQDLSPVKGAILGLFEFEDSLKPIYFAQTDATGKASLNYLKSGNYFVRAFTDQNNDLKITKTETVGFKDEPIQLDSTVFDSIPILAFSPPQKADIRTFQFISPGIFTVGATTSLKDAQFKINNTPIDSTRIKFLKTDSLYIFHNPKDSNSFQLTVQNGEFADTTKTRVTTASKLQPLSITAPANNIGIFKQDLVFTVNDLIETIDTSKIKIRNTSDSAFVTDYTYSIVKNEFIVQLQNSNLTKLVFEFAEDAVVGHTGSKTLRTEKSIQIKQEKELGTLNVLLEKYTNPVVLEVLLSGKTIRTIPVLHGEAQKLAFLEPGDYTFRIIIDENQNGLWDTGSFEEKRHAEIIQYFTEPTKVRANWEIELELIPQE